MRQQAEAERRRDLYLRACDVPFFKKTSFRRAQSTGDTERLSLLPPPEITLYRDPVGLLGLSPNRRTPCGRSRASGVPRQRSYYFGVIE